MLDELFEPEGGRKWSEPKFGLNINDVLRHIYKTTQQFVHRDKLESVLVRPQRGNALSDAREELAELRQRCTDLLEDWNIGNITNYEARQELADMAKASKSE